MCIYHLTDQSQITTKTPPVECYTDYIASRTLSVLLLNDIPSNPKAKKNLCTLIVFESTYQLNLLVIRPEI